MPHEPLSLNVQGVVLRHARRARALRWVGLMLVLPTAVFPFGWALATWALLRIERAYLDARRALLRSAPAGRTLRIDEHGLSVTLRWDRLEIRRAEVIEGWLEPGEQSSETRAAGCVVALRTDRGKLFYLLVEDETNGRAVLEAMGVGPLQQVLRVPLGSHASVDGQGPVFHLLGPLLLAMVSFTPLLLALAALFAGRPLGFVIGLPVLALIVGAWLSLLRYTAPGTAVVGADGISVEYPGRRRWFLSHARITDVRSDAAKVSVSSGMHRVDLPTASFVAKSAGYTSALAARILQARQEARLRADAVEAKVAVLDRAGRTLASWKAELAKLSGNAAGYRHVTFEPGELLAVVEDPTAPAERRVGAALALGASAAEVQDARVRVSVAAAACAYAPLRIAIDGAFEGEIDEDEVELALKAR